MARASTRTRACACARTPSAQSSAVCGVALSSRRSPRSNNCSVRARGLLKQLRTRRDDAGVFCEHSGDDGTHAASAAVDSERICHARIRDHADERTILRKKETLQRPVRWRWLNPHQSL